jgi:hypothetical protein
VEAFVAAGGGFLLAVLWFDLMFDVQARGAAGGDVPEPALASIAGYYGRVTTKAHPMNRLVAAAMLGTIAATIVEIATGDVDAWVAWVSLVLVVSAVGLAATQTVPNAVRFGSRRDPAEEQSRLARCILRDHVVCFTLIATLLVVQLVSAAS